MQTSINNRTVTSIDIEICDIFVSMLEYLVTGTTRRELLRLLWGRSEEGNVSALARMAGVSFSAAHRELEAMRAAGLAVSRRVGSEVQYRAASDHPHGHLLVELANLPDHQRREADEARDSEVRSWLADAGAPVAAPRPRTPPPPLEEALAEAVVLSHRDSTVARVLPVVLWNRRKDVDLDRLVVEATRRDERHALGCFLELAGRLGGEPRLVQAAQDLNDGRRRRARMFFAGRHGRYQIAATRRNTPPEALRWGYLMNVGRDSFESTFDKFAAAAP
jgi:DNA-binding transcriptional ArsR family regulator